ncbi:hypothetical protein GQ457_01G010300 [Hibiscus cannabinus]
MTLRSGMVIEQKSQEKHVTKKSASVIEVSDANSQEEGDATTQKRNSMPEPIQSPYVMQPPFPSRFIKQAEEKEILDVEINIPLLEFPLKSSSSFFPSTTHVDDDDFLSLTLPVPTVSSSNPSSRDSFLDHSAVSFDSTNQVVPTSEHSSGSSSFPLHENESGSQPTTESVSQTENESVSQPVNESISPTVLPMVIRKSSRVSKPPQWLNEYVCSFQSSDSSSKYPISSYVSYSHFPSHTQTFIASINTILEPKSYSQAIQNPVWIKAMQEEIQALENNHTWSLVSLPSDKTPIGCKWVYKVKYKSDGTVERYKARLVAKGYNQKEGIDYTETFSPVAKLVTVRNILALAAAFAWPLYQMDVFNAFLQGDLTEEVYMELPQGFCSQGRMWLEFRHIIGVAPTTQPMMCRRTLGKGVTVCIRYAPRFWLVV